MNHYQVVRLSPHHPTTHAAWSGFHPETLYGRVTKCGAHLGPFPLLHLAGEVTCDKCRAYIRVHGLHREEASV